MKVLPTPAQTRKAVAVNLRQFREKQDMSQDRLAKLARVDRKTINRIENGHFSPSLDTLTRLSRAQKKSINEYFKGAK